jgi:RNA polymerase sigma factor (sigma-70 family)
VSTVFLHNDQELLFQIREKNATAIWDLYQNGKHIAIKKLNRYMNDIEIEDVYSEAFTVFLEKIGRDEFVLTSKLTTYLTGIVINLGRTAIRKRGKKLSGDLATEYNDFEDDDLSNQMPKEHYEIVMSELEKMDKHKNDCYQIIILSLMEGKNNTTIARILSKKNENVVAVQKSNCLKRLKEEVFKRLKTHG